MRQVRLRSVLCVVWFAFGLFQPTALPGESIYRWVDASGRTRYSNVSPPSADSGVIVGELPAVARTMPVRKAGSPTTHETGKQPGDFRESAVPVTSQRDFLMKKIARCRAEIGCIERALRKRPDDDRLRKGLYRKRRYLEKDRHLLDETGRCGSEK
ncbi:MAG: DUF4124 domain-containing protein [Deltaproteobacteria bacterium]|nr:DUF4124 domain-containing protein [Deltaproteobacteria bacterium]